MYNQQKYDVRYNVVVSYDGYDHNYDKKIQQVMGRPAGGMGYGMDGRDVSFWFGTKPSIKKAIKRIKRLRKITSYRVWDTKIQGELMDSDITKQFIT